jgi:prepilin-type N-terminal cleavage/methylation domain-containing protein/prepilin-type processing-associated H-X9-DG protein
MHNAARRKSGFTLIELLVVIAIIAILAAILFPVFARARENARRAGCQSNLKQISLGMMQYTQDYDEKFPGYYTDLNDSNSYTFSDPVVANSDKGWTEMLQPYLKSTQILQCPSESTPPPVVTSNGLGFSDYFMNANVGGRRVGIDLEQPTAGGATLAQLQAPALTVMNGDGGAYNSENQMANWPYDAADPGMYRRHLGGNNFAFCDGHVKWFRPEKITTSPASAGNPTFSLD